MSTPGRSSAALLHWKWAKATWWQHHNNSFHLGQQKLTTSRNWSQSRSYKHISKCGGYGFALNNANSKYGVQLRGDSMLTSRHVIWGHGHTYRLGKGIKCLCYHVPQVDLAIYAMWDSQMAPSLSSYHIIFIHLKDIDHRDVQNKWSNKITIYEEYNLWRSPSEPARWGQGITGGND